MPILQPFLINAIWVIGLAGLLATFSYLDWYRTIRQWTLRETFRRPLALMPLYLSLSTFCIGLSLSALLLTSVAVSTPFALIKLLIWICFTIFFIVQAILVGRSGRRNGWDWPMEG